MVVWTLLFEAVPPLQTNSIVPALGRAAVISLTNVIRVTSITRPGIELTLPDETVGALSSVPLVRQEYI